ncbi:hypothetical protein MMC12_008062 [Toensbergia leucococca]|nr:hypothetical protein [Toensbergia leucococca]
MCKVIAIHHNVCGCFIAGVVYERCWSADDEENPNQCKALDVIERVNFEQRPYCRGHYFGMLSAHHFDSKDMVDAQVIAARQTMAWTREGERDLIEQLRKSADEAIRKFKLMHSLSCDVDFQDEEEVLRRG